MLGMGYWITEYSKVFLVYLFTMYIWPSVVFRFYLKGKNVTFRFAFCSLASVAIYNLLVLSLGLLHILYIPVFFILYWGIFLVSLKPWKLFGYDFRNNSMKLMLRLYTPKQFLYFVGGGIKSRVYDLVTAAWRVFKRHWFEYSLLGLIIIYALIYFSIGAFESHSYGCGDLYVHHAWIYGLIQGDIFSSGVYPEGMHTFAYVFYAGFGLTMYNVLLFLQPIHNLTLILSIYCLLKEIFQWRYSALLALVLFLIFEAKCIIVVVSFSRLQWSIPQEFGFYSIYLCVLFLIRYLKTGNPEHKKWIVINEDLLIFAMALMVSWVVHFYVTIIAFFICLAFVIFRLRELFQNKHFLSLVTAVLAGVIIGTLPMGGALLEGKELQGSIGWGLSIIEASGKIETPQMTSGDETEIQYVIRIDEDMIGSEDGRLLNEEGEVIAIYKADGTIIRLDEEALLHEEGLRERLNRYRNSIRNWGRDLYSFGYTTLFGSEIAPIALFLTIVAGILAMLCRIGALVIWKVQKIENDLYKDTLGIVSSCIVMVIMFSANRLGLPELIAHARLCSTAYLLMACCAVVTIDMLGDGLRRIHLRGFRQVLAVSLMVGEVALVVFTGNYHSYLCFELSRYNGAVETTERISRDMPAQVYTVVSMVDELYQVIQDGWHEEWYAFLKSQDDSRFTIPTEHVFLFIEKKPFQYGQSHFFTGPQWLAGTEYPEFYHNGLVSQEPKVTQADLLFDQEELQVSLPDSDRPSLLYSDLEMRTLIYSKAYDWIRRFSGIYPNEVRVYYEDEDFICYHFKQNPYALYNLALGY